MMPARKKKDFISIKTCLGAIWWCLVGLLFVMLVGILSAKASGQVPQFFGYSVINIISGSMEDEIPKDSYILIKRTSPDKVKEGDVITFYSTDPVIYGMPNTHRVVEEPYLEDGEYRFVTKGDANAAEDTVLAEGDRLIGVYVKRMEGLTAFSKALNGGTMIIVIVVLQLLLAGMVIYSVILKARGTTDTENNKN